MKNVSSETTPPESTALVGAFILTKPDANICEDEAFVETLSALLAVSVVSGVEIEVPVVFVIVAE